MGKVEGLPEEVTVKTSELRELFDHMENTSEKAPTLAPHLKEGADGPEIVTVRTTELQKLLENIDPSVFKRPSSPWSGVTLRPTPLTEEEKEEEELVTLE